MSATPTDRSDRVVCIPGGAFQCVGEVVVGLDAAGIAAWSIDTGAALWCAEGPYLEFALVGDEVHGLSEGEVPALRVRDARSGALLREAPLEDLVGVELSCLFMVHDGAYLLGVDGALQRRALEDGAALAEQAFAGRPTEWALAPAAPVLGVASARGAVAAFATDTLAPLWLREGLNKPYLCAAGDVFVVSGQKDEEATPYALIALDARTGRTRWRNGVFGRALACSEEAVLACDRSGWVAALDARTGEVRWRQCVGLPAWAGARVEGGFAVRVEGALVRLSDDGEERARWPFDDLPFSFEGAPGGAIVCGAAAVGAAIEGRGVAPLRGDRAIEPRAPGAAEKLPGRGLLTPAHARFEEARAVLCEVHDLDEAWETLAVRGVIPASWVDDPRRRFGSDAPSPAWGPRPAARGAMLAFAADVEGVVRVEALWRECLRRFGLDAGEAGDAARWACITDENSHRIGHFERCRGERMWDSLVAVLPPETLDALEAALVRERVESPDFDLRMCDAAWRTAAHAGLTVRVAGRALRVDASRNPYETLREIVATGYLVDADGVLRARPFDAELRALEAALYEEPFIPLYGR